MLQPTAVLCLPNAVLQPSQFSDGYSHLGEIIADEVARQHASEWIIPTFEPIIRTEYIGGPSRYSTEFLARLNIRNTFLDCKHGLPCDQCATCRDLADFRPWSERTPQEIERLARRDKYLDPFSRYGGYLQGQEPPTRAEEQYIKDQQRFSRCKFCKTEFTNSEGRPTVSAFEFCGESPLTIGECKRKWREAVGDLLAPCCNSRFNQVTQEDVDWALRQTPLKRSWTMPRLRRNFCPVCSLVFQEYVPLLHDGPDGVECVLYCEQRSFEEQSLRAQREVELTNYCAEQQALRNTKREQHLASIKEEMKALWGNQLQTSLDDDGNLTLLEGCGLDVIYSESRSPHHVFTSGCSGTERDGEAVDRCSNDYRGKLIFNAKWKRVGVEIGRTCLCCGGPLVKRKGTKYCSDNCRKRDHEERAC